MSYSIEPIERRYVKGCGFLSFARNLNNKYGQKLVIHRHQNIKKKDI